MARRLTDKEVDAARADPSFCPRPTRDWKFSPAESEDFVASILTQLGIAYEREDLFFPTQREQRPQLVELGFTPDFRLPDYEGWYIEVTTRKDLQEKNVKVHNAQAIYGIRILLITRRELTLLSTDPVALLSLLQLPVPVAA